MISALRGAARPALLLGLLIACGFAVRLLPGDPLRSAGTSPTAVVLIGAALCAVGLPRQLVCYAAGARFGLTAGLSIAMAAQMLGCATDLMLARSFARDWVAARIRGRMARIDGLLSRRPFMATLTLRLLPVGNNLLLNLAAGVSGIAALPFLAASAIGFLPQTAVFVLAGAGVGTARWLPVVLGVVLFALSAALGAALLRAERAGDRKRRVPIAS